MLSTERRDETRRDEMSQAIMDHGSRRREKIETRIRCPTKLQGSNKHQRRLRRLRALALALTLALAPTAFLGCLLNKKFKIP
jgi:hypothetical protein